MSKRAITARQRAWLLDELSLWRREASCPSSRPSASRPMLYKIHALVQEIAVASWVVAGDNSPDDVFGDASQSGFGA